MKSRTLLHGTGLALLAGCFIWSLWRVAAREQRISDPNVTTLRLAHWHLEPGLREAFGDVIAEYERSHPGVKIEQIAVPERGYVSWLRVQLIGGTAPDLLELPVSISGLEETIAANLVALGDEIDQPNPYNAGTPLEHVRWRETFLDNMEGSYSRFLSDYYQVPNALFTIRIYYNRTLWRELLGATPEPSNFAELRAICERLPGRAAARGKAVVPIASSKFHAPQILDHIFSSQTQRLAARLDINYDLDASKFEQAQALLTGEWGPDSPEVRRGYELIREAGRWMQPGFMQMSRDDAMFYFGQQRALMISSSAADAPGIFATARFDIGIFVLPIPDRSDPVYGPQVLGPVSEAGTEPAAGIGVLRGPNSAQALDFLRFLTSRRGNHLFSSASRWMPAVRGVEPPAQMRAFMPVIEGYPEGLNPTFGRMGAGLRAAYERNVHILFSPQGSVQQYLDQVQPAFRETLREDIAFNRRVLARSVVRYDTLLTALWMLHTRFPEKNSGQRFAESAWVQDKYETDIHWIDLLLDESRPQP